jgi:hypothetical protein
VVGLGVVGEHALDLDALLGVPREGAGEEGGAVGGAVGAEQLGVGESRVVVDRDVQVLPAGVAAAADAVLEDRLADRPEAAELLRVDMQQLTRPGALVADAPVARSSGQTRAARPAQDLADRRGGTLEDSGDHCRASMEILAPGEDLLLSLGRQAARLPLRRRGPVTESGPAALLEASPQPVAGRAAGAAGRRSRPRRLTSKNTLDNPAARLEREAHPSRRLRSVRHPGLPEEMGLGRPQASSGTRTESAVSQVCGQSS